MRYNQTSAKDGLNKAHAHGSRVALDESTLREIIGNRVCNQFNEIMIRMDKNELSTIATLPNTQEIIIAFLKSFHERRIVEEFLDYNNAIQAGLTYKKELLTKDGGVISASKLAELLGITRQAIDLRRKQNKLLAVTLTGGKEYYYPVWQLDENGVKKNFAKVMSYLTHMDPWSKMIFWLTENINLHGKRPIDELENSADLNKIIHAARLSEDQGG